MSMEIKPTQKDAEYMDKWTRRSAITHGISEERLMEMCNAERAGRCIVLPCKVGDAVYTIEKEFNGFGTELRIEKRIIDGCAGNLLNSIWVISKEPYELHYFPSEFGKTVFCTREEAEAAIKDMKEGQA